MLRRGVVAVIVLGFFAAPAASRELDWCAPIVVRPDQKLHASPGGDPMLRRALACLALSIAAIAPSEALAQAFGSARLVAKTIAAGANQLPTCDANAPKVLYYVTDAPATGVVSQPGGATGTARTFAICDPATSLYVNPAGAGGGTTLTDSASLRSALSDETGTGAAVFANSPTLTTPNIGTATGSVSGNAGTATALAANPANCSGTQYPKGIGASGAAEGCQDITESEIPVEVARTADIAPSLSGNRDPIDGSDHCYISAPPEVTGAIWMNNVTGEQFVCRDGATQDWEPVGGGLGYQIPAPWATTATSSIESRWDAFPPGSDPAGALVLDVWAAIGTPFLGGMRDDDDSLYTVSLATPERCASTTASPAGVNALTDFACSNKGVSYTVSVGSAQYALGVSGVPDAADEFLCRRSTTFEVCTDDAGTCNPTLTGSGEHRHPMVGYDAATGLYFPFGAAAVTVGCASGSAGTLATPSAIPYALDATADSIAPMYGDGIHLSPYGANLVAQTIATAKVEHFFEPRTNLVANGSMTTACTTGWQNGGGGGATLSAASFTPTNMNANGGVHGQGCQMSAGGGTNYLQNTTAFAVAPGHVYACRMYVKHAQTTLASAGNVTVQLVDGTSGTAFTDQVTQYFDGARWLPLASGVTSSLFQNADFHAFVVKGRAGAGSLTARVRVTGSDATSPVFVDSARCWLDPYQNLVLNDVFTPGKLRFYAYGDSQMTGTGTGTGYANWGKLAAGLDALFPVHRPRTTLVSTFATSNTSTGGALVQTLAASAYSEITSRRPSFGWFMLGLSDAFASRSSAQIATDVGTAFTAIKAVGSVPVWVTPPPMRGDTGSATPCASSTNCAALMGAAIDAVATGGVAN